MRQLLLPNASDAFEFAFDRSFHTTELFIDFFVGEAFELHQRDATKTLVTQLIEQAPAFIRRQRSVRWCRLAIDNLFDAPLRQILFMLREHGFASHGAAAPLLTVLTLDQVNGLAFSDDKQQLPEVISIEQLGEPAVSGSGTQTRERLQRDVFFVGNAARRASQMTIRKTGQLNAVAFPQLLSC